MLTVFQDKHLINITLSLVIIFMLKRICHLKVVFFFNFLAEVDGRHLLYSDKHGRMRQDVEPPKSKRFSWKYCKSHYLFYQLKNHRKEIWNSKANCCHECCLYYKILTAVFSWDCPIWWLYGKAEWKLRVFIYIPKTMLLQSFFFYHEPENIFLIW